MCFVSIRKRESTSRERNFSVLQTCYTLRMKRGFIVAAVVGLAVVGGAFLYKNSLPMAIIKSPLPNTVVGQKFTITGSAPLDWFSDNLTTMTIRTAEGFLLSSGGAAVQRGSTH